MTNTIRFILGNSPVELEFNETSRLRPSTTVLNYLRSRTGRTGVKEGCAEGDCGACTIVLAERGKSGKLVYRTVDSCLLFLPMIHGKQVITVEDLSEKKGGKTLLHPVQKMLLGTNGSQCGYCTPGMVMSLFGLFKNHRNPSREVLEDALAGNLCRCTGYQPILDAAARACSHPGHDHFTRHEAEMVRMLEEIESGRETLLLQYGGQTYHKPFTLAEALRLRKHYPAALVINGSTDVALRQTKKKELLPEILDLSAVSELQYFLETEDAFELGSGLTLETVKSRTPAVFPAMQELLKVFGSLQIRNQATLGGNIGSASPIGDLLPLLLAARAEVTLVSADGERRLPLENFLTGYRKTDLRADELIAGIRIPKPAEDRRFFSHKVSRRKDMDISTVSAGFSLRLAGGKVDEIILAYGGLAPTPKRATMAETYLTGKEWTSTVIREAMKILHAEFTPITDARAGAAYRATLAGNLLLKFFTTPHPVGVEDPVGVENPVGVGNPVGVSGNTERHITGESVFIDDMPVSGLLTGRVVYSPYAHAAIESIDISEAGRVRGVHAILTASSIPGENQMGPVIHDEPCLAEGEVTFIGQAVALIAAETEEAALEAEKRIRISYRELPAITDLQTAMEQGNLLAPPRTIERGDPEGGLKTAPHVIRGELHTGAQEHWYLETQAALAIPGEGREMMLHASSQNPAETQAIVAEVLGLHRNEVEVEVRRLGGGFGGKETQGNHVAAWSALLAGATGRPVRIRLFRDDDQIMTGKRHRFYSIYEAGFDDDGKILAWKVGLNADAGAAADLSKAILERAMLHADNAYYLPAVSITGRAWKTNLPSNTAFRGFGGPQGMAVIENAIDRIARFLKKDPAEIRRVNFYRGGGRDLTPYGQKVENNPLGSMFARLMESSGYEARRREINRFNQTNEFVKKGIALTPVKFGISFTTSHLNQAGALVNLYTDGTMLVNHGGTEMGQGLHEKIHRIASAEIGLPPEKVKVNATTTGKVPNTSPTAASSGSDLNGMAVKQAIDTLKERLRPVAAAALQAAHPGLVTDPARMVFSDDRVFDREHPGYYLSFGTLCRETHLRQVSLSATGYYRTPGIWFDRDAGHGQPFYYFAYGMAVSEVVIDTLTGVAVEPRTDILHDAGASIDPVTDRGQVEGGFIQGVGWCTTEEIKWDEAGRLLTHSPDTYKIPTIGDIPYDFRVKFLENAPNTGTIRGSKAVGEPPFMLGLSVWLAIKDAISAAGHHETEPEFRLPATGEVILEAVEKIVRPSRS